MNIKNNRKNVEWLKQDGSFEIAEPLAPKEYEKMENVGSMDEMIEYFTLIGDIGTASRIRSDKKCFLDRIK